MTVDSSILEPVVATSNGGYFTSKRRMNLGRWELTAKRLVFYQWSSLWMMFGVIGALIGMRSAGKRKVDLELTRIDSFARGKYGMNTRILDVKMTDGSEHRLSLDRFDDFTASLRGQLGQGAIEVGTDSWRVDRPQ